MGRRDPAFSTQQVMSPSHGLLFFECIVIRAAVEEPGHKGDSKITEALLAKTEQEWQVKDICHLL